MGEIRIKVNLTNAVDDDLASQGRLPREEVRHLEVTAVIETGAVTTVLPVQVVEQLGLSVRGQRVAQYADGRKDNVGVTGPVLFEMLGRNTLEEALILGDEVLIGQTILEKLDLLADCAGQRLVPNPERPDQPVLNVR
ncbi:MAG: clan AA aspartic protease [Planctomycetes bacterium]|nr:clan AA aspartic protease [Planctomycetota bacterium]